MNPSLKASSDEMPFVQMKTQMKYVCEGMVIMTIGRVLCDGGKKMCAILHPAHRISHTHTQECRAKAFSLWGTCLIMALQK